jgi:hypothetical protein
MPIPELRNPIAERPIADPQLTRDLRDRPARIDHKPNRFILELR